MPWTLMNKGYPGAFFNFATVAARTLEGSDGTVAIVQETFSAPAVAETLYEFDDVTEAKSVLGSANAGSVEKAFEGGALKVLVYTVTPAVSPAENDYTGAQTALKLEFFEHVTFDHPLTNTAIASWKTWAEDLYTTDDKMHGVFFGAAADTFTDALARSTANASDYLFNVGNAPDGMVSYEFAPLVAGYAASAPLTQSLTFKVVEDATDVNVRFTTQQKKDALAEGVGVVFAEFNGRNVKLVRGVSTNGTSLQVFSQKQALLREFKFLFEERHAGKFPNSENGRIAAQQDYRNFMQVWADRGVIEPGTWYANLTAGPGARQVVLDVYAVNYETMEELYGTITFAQGGGN